MLLAGLQKLSLLDVPGQVACTVFTGGCNLRCPWCHNSELLESPPSVLTEEAFFSFLSSRRGMLDAVCITGGEPCLQKDLPSFLSRIHDLGFFVKLDTNGFYPDLLSSLLSGRLVDYVAMDIKNCPERYAETAGLRTCSLDTVGRSVSLLLSSGLPFELRTTVVMPFHDAASFEGIRNFLQPYTDRLGRIPSYYLQAFVDRETVRFSGMTAPDRATLEAWAQILSPIAKKVDLRGV